MNATTQPQTSPRGEQAAQAPAQTSASVRKVLSFGVSGERYAIPIGLIKEIIEYGTVTRVPMTPPHISGVLNLRGSVVPVIDLAARLDKGVTRTDKRTCIVVLALEQEGESLDLGILVDRVHEVLDIPERDIEPAPSFGASIRPEYIDGMAKVRGRFVVILDESSTLSVDDLAAIDPAAWA